MINETEKTVTYPVTVQFEDVDSYRIVHHTKLIAYLERARVHYLAQMGYDIREKSHEFVLYAISITFKKTARLLDELTVSVSLKSVETFRCTLDYRIRRGNDLIAKAETDIAFIDPQTKEIVPVPQEFQL